MIYYLIYYIYVCYYIFFRLSNNSVSENPFQVNQSTTDRASLSQTSQQWPPSFLLNKNQGPLIPLSVSNSAAATPSKPKRHPLRQESVSHEIDYNRGRRQSSLWPFPTTDMIFREQTKDIKQNDLFLNT